MRPPEENTELPWRVPDSEVDAKAARAAGMGFVAVSTGTTPAEIPAQHALRAMLAGVGEIVSALPWRPTVRLALRWQHSTHRAEAPSGAGERQPGCGSTRTVRSVREPPPQLGPRVRSNARAVRVTALTQRPVSPSRGWRDLCASRPPADR